MAESFLVLWSQDRIKSLKAKGELGTPLRVVYGSPHQSAPSLLRYGVTSGDTIFVVGLKGGALHLISKVQVAQIVSADDFFRDHLRLPPAELNLRLWELEKRLALSRPELGHMLPFGCVDEAAIPSASMPIRLDMPVPESVLAAVRFRSKKGEERSLHLEDGKLKTSTSIQGHYLRLTPDSAAALEAVLNG